MRPANLSIHLPLPATSTAEILCVPLRLSCMHVTVTRILVCPLRYGLLRSPWNTNNVPYLMRSNTTFYSFADSEKSFPSCSNFAAYMNSSLSEVRRTCESRPLFFLEPTDSVAGPTWVSCLSI